ncbi:MAG: hypothetical protein WCL70_03380 [Paludibacter sp.]
METPINHKILLELQKRRQGYLFGGPLVQWCEPVKKDKEFITIKEKNFTGCKKYAQCTNISANIKWKAWKDLDEKERQKLIECHCYRANKDIANETPTYTWDPNFIEKRIEPEWKWVGNPFGIRNKNSKYLLSGNYHRDIKPCSLGGCITPEMQAEYNKEINPKNVKNYWGEIKACPFYFKSKDEKFETFEKNIARFAQCYVTQKEVIELLKENRFITASTLFRDIYSKKSSETFWYPFFSGYSYIQLLYQTNEENGWKEFSPQLRWHATTIQRLTNTYLSNTNKIFTECENGSEFSKKHDEIRFLDVCDGYASWMLLTWVLIQRFKSINSNNPDIKSNLTWIYSDNLDLLNKLNDLGFGEELIKKFFIKRKLQNPNILRSSTLEDDLNLLGLKGSNENSENRFNHLVTWIKNSSSTNENAGIYEFIEPIRVAIKEFNSALKINDFIDIYIKYVKETFPTINKITKFKEKLLLNPPIHLIVRAFLTTPLRWCFIPINTDLNEFHNNSTLTSGIIVLIEDSIKSRSYNANISDADNVVLNRFNNIFPLLSAVNNIEEQNLRDEEEKKRRELEIEKERQAIGAAISQVMARNMSHNIGSHVLSKLLTKESLSKVHFIEKEEEFYQCTNTVGKEIENLSYSDQDLRETKDYLLANFFSYLKTRMDYLADVTTSTPVLEHTKDFYKGIIEPFVKNRVVNDRISGINEFPYSLSVCYQNDESHNCKIEHESCKKQILSYTANDKSVSIPNDILGNHAFYTILENIIRNTAKHATTDNKPVIFNIKIEEGLKYKDKIGKTHIEQKKIIESQLEELYAISIFDNTNVVSTKKVLLVEKEREYFKKHKLLKKIDSLNGVEALVFEQNNRLNKSILKIDGSLRQGNWGLIEMDASAAYLRKIPVNEIDDDKYRIDLFEDNINSINDDRSYRESLVIFKAYVEQDKYIGYRFFIKKPQDVLIVGEDKDIFEAEITQNTTNEAEITQNTTKINEIKRELKNQGIWVVENTDVNKVYPHKLVVIVNKEDEINNVLNNIKFSRRVVYSKNFKKISKLNKHLIYDLWTIFFQDEDKKADYYRDAELYDINGKRVGNELNYYAQLCDHGVDYCELVANNDNKFIEIGFSATEQFTQLSGIFEKIRRSDLPKKIMVIDERIQTHSLEKYKIKENECTYKGSANCYHEKGVPYQIIYKNTNITVPEKDDCNLNAQSFSKIIKQKTTEYEEILKFINDNILDKEFIVIHLGIIEKLISAYNNIHAKAGVFNKEDRKDVERFIKKVIIQDQNLISMYYDKIVVTSGRGKPHNLPSNIRYLNFSIVSQYMIDLRNKFAFTEALYSARNFN